MTVATTFEDVREAVYAKNFDEAWAMLDGLPEDARVVAESLIRDHQREVVDFVCTFDGVKLRVLEKNYVDNGVAALLVEVAETVRRQPDEYELPETHYAGECWAILTTNLDEKPGPGEFFIKTWDESSKALRKHLLKVGPFEKTGRTIRVSQWAEAEVWRVRT